MNDSFVAIDFETMTSERSSACAIGMAKVAGGVIVQQFYSLINPIPDNSAVDNSRIHGITREMTSLAPSFENLFDTVREFIGGCHIVCHNAPFDMAVMQSCMDACCLSGIDTANCSCTFALTGSPLEEACELRGIKLGAHHNALDDAIACAKLYLDYRGTRLVEPVAGHNLRDIMRQREGKKYDRSTLDPLADECVSDQSTPFFHAKVVITGTFDAFPSRNKIGLALQSLGADMNTAISGKTNIVVMGDGAGPAKIAKIQKLNLAGAGIRVMEEDELAKYIADIYPKM